LILQEDAPETALLMQEIAQLPLDTALTTEKFESLFEFKFLDTAATLVGQVLSNSPVYQKHLQETGLGVFFPEFSSMFTMQHQQHWQRKIVLISHFKDEELLLPYFIRYRLIRCFEESSSTYALVIDLFVDMIYL
jgi:hypothetical protein